MLWRAVRQGKVSGLQTRRYAAREGEPSLRFRFASLVSAGGQCGMHPGVTEPTLALCSPARLTPRQVSARFRPRSSRTHQLSDRSTSLPRTAARTLSLRSDGRKLARPSGKYIERFPTEDVQSTTDKQYYDSNSPTLDWFIYASSAGGGSSHPETDP